MTTIKSFTDLEQSKKLADILPLESADMLWEQHGAEPYVTIKPWTTVGKSIGCHCLGCWSLAALLGVLPSYEINNFGDGIQLDIKNEAFVTEGDETLLDLVVNMIIHLHELKML